MGRRSSIARRALAARSLGVGRTVATLAVALAASVAGSLAAPRAARAADKPLDAAVLDRITGLKGALDGPTWRATRDRDDLRVRLDGFDVSPRMGLASTVTITPAGDRAIALGELVMGIDEVQAVTSALIEGGVVVTALHAPLLGEEVRLACLHLVGRGEPAALARALRAALDASRRVRSLAPAQTADLEAKSDLDPAHLDALLRVRGEYRAGVYRVTVARRDLDVSDGKTPLTPAMGMRSWAAFEGAADHAAATGDVLARADEVGAVAERLRRGGLSVTSVHAHELAGEPRVAFVRFWGVGRADDLARAVHDALLPPPRAK